MYTFQSERLGFRNWKDSDLSAMAAISANPAVMEFFPNTQSKEHTQAFIKRMQVAFEEKGFCYFAVDTLADQNFIGFIGLCEQTYETDFTPCVDIGWRLDPKFWGKGYATEGAKRCLQYAFEDLNLEEVLSIAPQINTKSIKVMDKIGMKKIKTFEHPLLLQDERLKSCVLYGIK